jgi:putative radical SAM enzyme (TIGR03279 family)
VTKTGHRIAKVYKDSIADELGVEAGDALLAVNNKKAKDILDFLDWMNEAQVELTIKKSDGEEWILDIEKEPDEELGIEFEEELLDKQRSCANHCIFCFVDQLPENTRDTLHYKDDDWRMSFLMGNYITLTNLSPNDVQRIIDKHISPLYISVHTTNPELRVKMLRNKRAGSILNTLERFRDAGILLHCQIVLCPGWNDGSELDRTLEDLWRLREIVQSVAVVPVGLTGHRQGLEVIDSFDKQSANEVINQVIRWQQRCRREGSTAFVFAADELFVMAERQFPSIEEYEDFPQIENGVGLCVKFREEVGGQHLRIPVRS